jgi:hypothetical protein
MTPDENRLLDTFLNQLKAIKGHSKDAEADQKIQSISAQQPDALYLLVQRALLQDQALKAAQQEIEQLKSRLEAQTPSTPGFLNKDPWGQATPRQAYSPQASAPIAPSNTGMGSFLGQAATTAAGVAAGAFLFQGIESLMGHHGYGSPYQDMAYQDAMRPENVTINEYYDGHQPEDAHFNQDDSVNASYDDDGIGFSDDDAGGFDV